MSNRFFSFFSPFFSLYSRLVSWCIAVSTTLFFYSISVVLQNKMLIYYYPSIFPLLLFVHFSTMSVYAGIQFVVICVLSGMLATALYHIIQRQISFSASIGVTGTILGILAPACPSCAIGTLGLVGIGGLFAFLPFKGRELGLISIMLLLFSLYYTTKKLGAINCQIS